MKNFPGHKRESEAIAIYSMIEKDKEYSSANGDNYGYSRSKNYGQGAAPNSEGRNLHWLQTREGIGRHRIGYQPGYR